MPELHRVGVNRLLLRQEYKEKYHGGYSYSHFCYHFQKWHASNKSSLHIEQKPGDKLYVDFAGNTMTRTLLLTQRHKSIAQLFDENFWKIFLGCPSVEVRK